MSTSARRRELSPRSGKLRMDRQPAIARITDPSLAAGKRKELDNVMKKARASSNDYWDKKLLEVEEKDPNRWRHTGYKKMYIEGESSSGSERDAFRYNNRYRSRSPSHNRQRGGGGGGGIGGNRRTPPSSPPLRRRVPSPEMRRMSPPDMRRPRSPDGRRPRSPEIRRRPRSPPEPPLGPRGHIAGKSPRSPRSPMEIRRRSPSPPGNRRRSPMNMLNKRAAILPRSKRPPSPPPKPSNSRSNSSVSSCSDDSCSVCSPKHRRPRSRSNSVPRSRPGPRSPPPKMPSGHSRGSATRPPPPSSSSSSTITGKSRVPVGSNSSSSSRMRPVSPPPPARPEKYRDDKLANSERNRAVAVDRAPPPEPSVKVTRTNRHSSPPEDPRLKIRPPEPPEPAPIPKKKKEKTAEKLRTKIKIEGEKRKKHTSSESEDSSDSEGSLPTFTATTRLTLSERFGKMAQWSIDRSNMENMRITKDSTGGALKVMIEEGLESPPRRYSYSPAPAGHFPEELATTAPSGMLSWDDVRVRYEYYKNRGYLRDLDLKDYVKWEEWWYKYQEWLKQERYYEFWERQQLHRRRRKKVPIAQRLN